MTPAEPRDEQERTPWRIGSHYGIHVYEGDRPVATFHTVADARAAVEAYNALAAAVAAKEAAEQENARLRELLGIDQWSRDIEPANVREIAATEVRKLATARAERAEAERDGACEVAAQLQVERNELWHERDALRDRVQAVEARLAQFGIPLTGDPEKTFCQVCQTHNEDLPLHDYQRHGLSPAAADSEPDLLGEWVDRLLDTWRESPNTRAEITARFSALAWVIDHIEAARAAAVTPPDPKEAK